jgi:hypothetical protein
MGRLGANNLNLNLNLNTVSAQGLPAGVRFNSQEFPKLLTGSDIFPSETAPNYKGAQQAANAMRFREFWDAELRASIYLNEFLTTNPAWMAHVARRLAPLHRKLHEEKGKQLRDVIRASDEREPRFAEIIDQNDGEGVVKYFTGMLMLDAGGARATYALLRVARRIGEIVVMCLKEHFHEARPSEVCPAIVPMFDPPITPSFPAGHALQSHLIAALLALTRPSAEELLEDLADRIAYNRTVAGVHYLADNEGGRVAALALVEMLTRKGTHPLFAKLLEAAQAEGAPAKPHAGRNGSRP